MPSGRVVVALRRSPWESGSAEEGLRVAIGLTILHPRVDVLLLADAVSLALPERPAGGSQGWERHWRTLGELGQRRLVEHESLAARGADAEAVSRGAEVVPRAYVDRLLLEAVVVAVF